MTLALGIGIAGMLAAGFAFTGEAVLRRDSRTVVAWNDSMLVGMGICAAALFPLSLLWPGQALRLELALMAAGAMTVVARRFARRKGPETEPPRRREPFDPVALALFALLAAVVAIFVYLDLRYAFLWDGFQIWASRAQLIFSAGGLEPSWYTGDFYEKRVLEYPPLIPLYESLLCFVRGRFDFDFVKPVFLCFYPSMLVSTYAATRTLASRRWSLTAALLLALLPMISTGSAAGGYADMPQAAVVAAVVSAGLRGKSSSAKGWIDPLPWLIGTLLTVKSEGLILAVLAAAAVLLFVISRRPVRWPDWRGIGVVVLFAGLRAWYTAWLGVHDPTYGPVDASHLARIPSLLGELIRLSLAYLFDPSTWSFFWPAFLLASAVVMTSGSLRVRCVAAATLGGLLSCSSVFLFTNWDLSLHMEQAFQRLLSHLAPAAAVVIAAAGAHVWSSGLVGAVTKPKARAPSRGAVLWPGLRIPIRAFFFAVALAALLCGAWAVRRQLRHFAGPPPKVVSAELRAQIRRVEARLPPGAALIYAPASPEYWHSRLWQRVLYPRNDVILVQPPVPPGRLAELRAKYGVRFALAAGDPPADPGFLWKVDIGRAPGTGDAWFGELKP